jgi:hypothetical protein
MVISFLVRVLFLSSFLTLQCCCYGAKWIPTNPGGGGAFNSPVLSLSSANHYWAVGSDLGGVYLTLNNGTSWSVLGSTNGLTATHIASMIAHPNGYLLIGTDTGLFISTKIIRKKIPTIRQTYDTGYVSAIALSANSKVVYATVHPAYDQRQPYVLRSINGGKSWNTTKSNLPSNLRITGMRTHPVDSNAIWVIAGEGRFNVPGTNPPSYPKKAYLSIDGGQTFTRRDPMVGELVDMVYSYDVNNLNLMYATATVELDDGTRIGKIFRSDESGFSWIDNIVDGDGEEPTGVILADATNAAHVRVIDLDQRNGIIDSYLFESYNAGASWTKKLLTVTGGWSGADEVWGMGYSYQGLLQTIGYNPSNPSTILWVNPQFLYISTNRGINWNFGTSQKVGTTSTNWRSRGIDNVVPLVVEPSRVDSKLVYAGYMDMGLWRSDDNGYSWNSINVPMYSGGWNTSVGGNTLTILSDPIRPDVVWAQMGGDMEACGYNTCDQPFYLLKSINRGETWINLVHGLPNPIRRLEGLSYVPPSTGSTSTSKRQLFAAVNGNIYKSIDDGSTWQLSLKCQGCTRTFCTASGSIFVFSSNATIYRSSNGGTTWVALTLPTQMTSSWTIGDHWLHDQWSYTGPTDLASKGNSLWIAVKGYNKGVYYSADNGYNWKRVLVDSFTRAVEVDPITGEVYVGSSSALSQGGYSFDSSGIRVSSDGKSNWHNRNQGLAYPFATAISISTHGTKWIISPGQGVMKWS